MSTDAAFCPHCGAPQTSASPASSTAQQVTSTPIAPPAKWRLKFNLLEKAGGHKMQKIKDLSVGERYNLNFNVWGFLFGPIYYLKLGMWKKALTYTGLGAAGIMLMELICSSFDINGGSAGGITSVVIPAIFGTRANVDYYKKIMLGINEWI
jgi:Protein of unknown function (DUF2628)